MTSSLPKHPRPLSPHLQIYRWPLNMALSILHRMTGVGLAVGLLMLTWLLYALANGPDAWATFTGFTKSPIGTLFLMGWSFAICFHGCSGIRHLVFDTARFLDIKSSERAGKIVLAASIILTAMLWLCAFGA